MYMTLNPEAWAEEMFSACELGDKRRTNRLIEMASRLCRTVGESMSHCCHGDESALEGAYRFIRNDMISPSSIAEGIFKSTEKRIPSNKTLLAIQDSTTLGFQHSVKEELGDLGGPADSNTKGFHVHSVLLLDAESDKTIGLIDQMRWQRKQESRGSRHERKGRSYEAKESFKWECSSRRVSTRLSSHISNVISVCDRESDIYEYLCYQETLGQRYIIRASQNRCLESSDKEKLLDALEGSPSLGVYQVRVLQKSGRQARIAEVELRSCRVMLRCPRRMKGEESLPIEVNVVCATERNAGSSVEALSWVLLTSEPVESFESARLVTSYYEKRWRIEDFHKAWKTGAGAEEQRMQHSGNLERMLVILSSIAIRLLQLKEGLEKEEESGSNSLDCTTLLTDSEWKVLWLSSQGKKKKRLPEKIPKIGWAYKAVAKLGGWSDSKRIGRASWETIWKGWYRLQERVEGYILLKNGA